MIQNSDLAVALNKSKITISRGIAELTDKGYIEVSGERFYRQIKVNRFEIETRVISPDKIEYRTSSKALQDFYEMIGI